MVVDATRAVVGVHQRHDYAHVPGGFEEAHFGGEARRNEELAGGERTDLHDLRREPSAAARWHRSAAHRLDAPCPREGCARPPGSSRSGVGSLRRWPIADLASWCSTSTTSLASRRPPTCSPTSASHWRRSSTSTVVTGRLQGRPDASLQGDAERGAGAPDPLDSVRPDEAPFSGDELHHLSRDSFVRAHSVAGAGPRALHDGSPDRRRSRPLIARRRRIPLLVISEDVFPEIATELGGSRTRSSSGRSGRSSASTSGGRTRSSRSGSGCASG